MYVLLSKVKLKRSKFIWQQIANLMRVFWRVTCLSQCDEFALGNIAGNMCYDLCVLKTVYLSGCVRDHYGNMVSAKCTYHHGNMVITMATW